MTPRSRLKKNRDLPPNLGYHLKNGVWYWYYINPVTKVKTYWGVVNRKRAIAATNKLNAHLIKATDLVDAALKNDHTKADEYLFSAIMARFETEAIPTQDIKPKTLNRKLSIIKRLTKDLSNKNIEHFSLRELAAYLDDNFTGDTYIRVRSLLSEVYRFAKRKGLYTGQDNPADDTEHKQAPAKQRQRLTKEGYKAIYAVAPQWLQDAMDLALITLQGRYEIVNAQYDHEIDGYWHIIREKTKDQTEKAYIRFPIHSNLRSVIDRCRKRPLPSPYLIAKKPDTRNREQLKNKDHWTQILPDYLSKAFAKARDKSGAFEHLTTEQKPSFHEIRSLGGDLYIEQGYSKEYVNLLYGHTTIKMTEHYLKGHRITWSECEADLDLTKALKA